MAWQSKNMNYIFNVEYFEGLSFENEKDEEKLNKRNQDIEKFRFQKAVPIDIWKGLNGYQDFELYTKYPGLLIGTGNEHSLSMKGAIKCGFSFDYVTGIPYIPGSSLKGALRAYFPGDDKEPSVSVEYSNYIYSLLGREDVDLEKLKENIFENGDVFLGAYPVLGPIGSALMQMEFITPHTAGKFKDPNPINQIKVKPEVKFVFCFILKDYVPEKGGQSVTAEEKKRLFEQIILDMGIGAKTNVGFGRFGKEQLRSVSGHRNASGNGIGTPPKCATRNCNNKVKYDDRNGRWYRYCPECSAEYRRKHPH